MKGLSENFLLHFLNDNPLVMIHKITWWKDVVVLVSILGIGSSLRGLNLALEWSLQEQSKHSCTCPVNILQIHSPWHLALLTCFEEQGDLHLQLGVSSQVRYTAVLYRLVVSWYQLHKKHEILLPVNLCFRSATGSLTRTGLF